MDLLFSLCGACLPCFPSLSSPSIVINNNKYKIIKLLGEGGFSYVYLVSTNSQSYYALKKIRCPYGVQDESFKNAIKEIKNYHRFKSPYIISSIDELIQSENDGSKNIMILLPYFERSLQDLINQLVLNNSKMEESEILRIFVGICRGLKVMHNYKKVSNNNPRFDDDEQDILLPVSEDEDFEDNVNGTTAGDLQMSELVPFAHHDLKPANVMLSAEGLPVLCDLGSCSRARISVKNRQQALTVQDFAQEHCTLPYRAPELVDVATNTEITEKTDIWSLGCLLYCCCFGYSPFEKLEIEQGASLNLAILQGKYEIPADNNGYDPKIIDLIKQCLQLKPENRPDTDEILEKALEVSRQLNV
ncbi:ENV7 Serine/threonine-protein kinase ENV7 [Candida maltosa Xu316]